MNTVIITGSSGLVGSACTRFFSAKGFKVVGIDNDMRRYFFGDEASTLPNRDRLTESIPNFQAETIDIRDAEALKRIFLTYGSDIKLIIHAAAQPSHDWAAKEPLTDFTINANGTLNLLELTRQNAPHAPFIFTSTNKVYGDTPNRLPLVETETRWELDSKHPFYKNGIDESMSIDHNTHSLFGVSKAAADLLVQEYGRYFGLKSGIFRAGCLTGPNHTPAEYHGFLSYLMHCAVTGRTYRVFGYKGKQVRDNLHSDDLAEAFYQFYLKPGSGAVYNIGGSRFSSASLIEAVALSERITGNKMKTEYVDTNRIGDHIWWISSVEKFKTDYPDWKPKHNIESILSEICNRKKISR